MKKVFRFIAAAALVCLCAASCDKDNKEDNEVKGPTDFSGGCEAVDLGLSVKWASYNVGAQHEYDWGFYFAWGETASKAYYGWSKEGDYKWGIPDWSELRGMTKYTADVEGGDGLMTLLPEDDAATVNWGKKWRTPTYDEIKELLDKTKCEWIWDSVNIGYTVKGLMTGNSIFIPAAGCRYESNVSNVGIKGKYWSSSVVNENLPHAYDFSFSLDSGPVPGSAPRKNGYSVRAVTEY